MPKESERALLGTVLFPQLALLHVDEHEKLLESFFDKIPNDSYFSEPSGKELYRIAKGMFDRGEGIDFVSMSNELDRRKTIFANQEFLFEIESVAETAFHFQTHMKIVREAGLRRGLEDIASGIRAKLESDYEIQDIMSEVDDDLLRLSDEHYGQKVEIIGPGELLKRRLQGIELRRQSGRVMTTYSNLDALLVFGQAPRTVSIIAGRASMGKSALKTNLSNRYAEQGIGLVHFESEQGFDYERDRSDAIRLDWEVSELGKVSEWVGGDAKMDEIRANAVYVDKYWNITYVTSMSLSMQDCFRILKGIKRKRKVDIVFFDLFQDFIGVDFGKSDRHGAVIDSLKIVKQMATELNVHICLLVQISRGVEGRAVKRPFISDLRESGNYEEVGDLILLIYRGKYYDDTLKEDTIEIIVGKQRYGPRNVVAKLKFDEVTLRITEYGK